MCMTTDHLSVLYIVLHRYKAYNYLWAIFLLYNLTFWNAYPWLLFTYRLLVYFKCCNASEGPKLSQGDWLKLNNTPQPYRRDLTAPYTLTLHVVQILEVGPNHNVCMLPWQDTFWFHKDNALHWFWETCVNWSTPKGCVFEWSDSACWVNSSA